MQSTIVISTKGYGSLFYTEKKVDLTYIDAIFTMKFQPWKTLFIGIGPQIGYIASARYSQEIDQYHQESKSVNKNHNTNVFDIGLNGTLGCQFKSGIGLEVAIIYGMRPVFNEYGDEIEGYTPTIIIQCISQKLQKAKTWLFQLRFMLCLA